MCIQGKGTLITPITILLFCGKCTAFIDDNQYTSVCDSNTKWDRKLFFCCCRESISFVSPTSGKKCVSHSWSLILLRQKLHVFLLLFFFPSVACFYLSNMRNVKLRLPLLVWKLFKVLRGEAVWGSHTFLPYFSHRLSFPRLVRLWSQPHPTGLQTDALHRAGGERARTLHASYHIW